jgi:hypothetical protein
MSSLSKTGRLADATGQLAASGLGRSRWPGRKGLSLSARGAASVAGGLATGHPSHA